MGKSSNSPDYVGAANADAQANKEATTDQTWANRPDQNNPWGSTSWNAETGIDPATGQTVNKWTQNETLDPLLQGTLDSELQLQKDRTDLAGGMMGRVGDELGEGMDWDQFGDMTETEKQQAMSDPSMWQDKAFENSMAMSQRKLDPQFAREGEQLEISLRNKGLRPGDQAYDDSMEQFNTRKTDAYNLASMSAQDRAGAEGSRMQQMEKSQLGYNQDLAGSEADRANQLRQAGIKEEMTKRGFSLNEINALISGQQVQNPSFENFSPAGKADTPRTMDALIAENNAKQAGSQGMMSGVGGLLTGVGAVGSMFN